MQISTRSNSDLMFRENRRESSLYQVDKFMSLSTNEIISQYQEQTEQVLKRCDLFLEGG